MQSLQFIAYMADVHADMKVYETTSPSSLPSHHEDNTQEHARCFAGFSFKIRVNAVACCALDDCAIRVADRRRSKLP